jgi:6-phosphofructokinase 1
MNTGILIAGGICPGVHNLVNRLTLYEKSQGNNVIGFRRGFGGLNINDRSEMPTLSCDTMKLEMAVHSLKDVDRLYCLCGNKSMESAGLLALDERVNTNIIGIAKTMFDDIVGFESVGARSAALKFEEYVEESYSKAVSDHSIVLIEMPSEKMMSRSVYNKVTDIVNGLTVNKISMHQIKNNYNTNGYALVLITGTNDYWDIIEFLQQNTDTDVRITSPNFTTREMEPCLYDKILSERVAREAFEYAQTQTNFIVGGGGTMKFEDYLDIV